MSDVSRVVQSSVEGERGLGVARMADMVCEATRRVALDGATSALKAVASRVPEAANVLREIAEPILSRATIMQIEIDRFMAVARLRHSAEAATRRNDSAAAGHAAGIDLAAHRNKAEDRLVTTFIAAEKEQTRCHSGSHRLMMRT